MKHLVYNAVAVVQKQRTTSLSDTMSLRFSNAKGLLGSTGTKGSCPTSCSLPTLPLRAGLGALAYLAQPSTQLHK